MKTTVIYHSADFDGIFCREIARKFLPPDTEFIGWNHGDKKIDTVALEKGVIYILDLSPECLAGTESGAVLLRDQELIWIDHHKTEMEKFSPEIPGYRIDGVAACRLAWQWFSLEVHNAQHRTNEALQVPLPLKPDYVDRSVTEPWAVRLAGEYDIWDKRDPDADLFQHGLRSRKLDSLWEILLSAPIPAEGEKRALADIMVAALLDAGSAIQFAKQNENDGIITSYGFTVNFEGLCLLVCNHARFNSHLFTAGIKPEHEGLMGFVWSGKDWRISLYGVPGKPDVDLAKIAVKYGGGGHKQACGFRVKDLLLSEGHVGVVTFHESKPV